MQFLAIMKGRPGTSREKVAPLAKQETLDAWAVTKADVMRTLWYQDRRPRPCWNGGIA